jgi:hypothetical protein
LTPRLIAIAGRPEHSDGTFGRAHVTCMWISTAQPTHYQTDRAAAWGIPLSDCVTGEVKKPGTFTVVNNVVISDLLEMAAG